MKKLAIVLTHPIQYYAPWFRLISERQNCQLKVFYTWSQSKDAVKDRKFGKEIKWDIPLLEGYEFEFIENVSKKPGSHHFFGIDCPSLIPRLSEYKPDAILFFGWNFKSHLLAMRHFKGRVKVWFRGDSTLLDETGGFKTKLRRLVLQKVYTYIDKAFYVGKANKAYFIAHGVAESQLVRAPHAIDNDRFKDGDDKKYREKAEVWRKELGFESKDIVVLFAGKFEDKKQPDTLISSLIEVNKIRSNSIKLLLVGNGPMEKSLQDMTFDNQHIIFLPFQNQTQMPIVYRLGDVLCLPSKGPGETWGLAVNEAMACGRPVIVSSKVGCADDLVKDTDNGYVFEFNKIQELTHILSNLSKEELKILGGNAQNYIENYNFRTIVEALEKELLTT